MTRPREINNLNVRPRRYSVCTLVNDADQYREMHSSFQLAGFGAENCEFLFADNTQSNRYDAFEAINLFLQEALGEYIIICHQDIRLHDDNIDCLDRAIEEITAADPYWGVLGNAGGVAPGQLAIRITDAVGVNTDRGPFPVRVDAMDENFIIVRRSANLCVSRDLSGFHFYGTDLCIVADILGYSSYAINFHLHHLGGESTNEDKSKHRFHSSYPKIRQTLIAKYRRAFRSRWIQNTGTIMHLSASRLKSWLWNMKFPLEIAKGIGKFTARHFANGSYLSSKNKDSKPKGQPPNVQ